MTKKILDKPINRTIYLDSSKWEAARAKLLQRGRSVNQFLRKQIDFLNMEEFDDLEKRIDEEIEIIKARKIADKERTLL